MTEEPSLVQKGVNLSKFAWDLMSYMNGSQGQIGFTHLMSSDEVFNERISICKSCDKYKKSKQECLECGCFIPAKAKIILDSCPLNKWTVDQSDWEERFTAIQNGLDNNSKLE